MFSHGQVARYIACPNKAPAHPNIPRALPGYRHQGYLFYLHIKTVIPPRARKKNKIKKKIIIIIIVIAITIGLVFFSFLCFQPLHLAWRLGRWVNKLGLACVKVFFFFQKIEA